MKVRWVGFPSLVPGSVLGCSELPAEVFRRCVVKPVSIDHAQVPHVALVRVEQLVVGDAGRLAVEEDGGGVNGHQLVRVGRGVGAVRLQLGRVHEEAVRQAAADVPCVGSGGFQRYGKLGGEAQNRNTTTG